MPPGTAYKYRFFGMFRLFLAALVMYQHFVANAVSPDLTLRLRSIEAGSISVSAFFALSGFVILEAAEIFYQGRWRAFLSNRALRLVPHFLLAVVLSMLAHWYFVAHGILHVERGAPQPGLRIYAPGNILMNLIGFLPLAITRTPYSFVPIGWAVGVEVLFYAIIAFALFASARSGIGARLGFRRITAALALLLAVPFAAAVAGHAPQTLTFAPYFVFGAAYYMVLAGARGAWTIVIASAACIVAQFMALPALHPTLLFSRDIAGEAMLLCALMLAFCVTARITAPRLKKADAEIGKFTYPLYLYHYTVLVIVTGLWPEGRNLTALLGMAASLGLAVLMAMLVDPAVDGLRARIRGRPALA